METNSIVLDDSAGGVVIVAIGGEHDISTLPVLRKRLDEALASDGGLVVDLTAATFLDSSVLGALLDARKQVLENKHGFVTFLGEDVDPGVRRILDVTGLAPVFAVMSDRAAAIDSARNRATQ